MRDAIMRVLKGGVWTPPDVDLEGARMRRAAELMARLATLTPQQVRVLMMLSEGLLNKQIAYELSVSEATVKAHVSAILQKLGVESRTQAVIAAAKIEARPVAAGASPARAESLHTGDLCDPPRPPPRSAARAICAISARSAAGLIGLLSTWTSCLRGLRRARAGAVGGDQDRRQVGAEAPAQLDDGLDAVAVVEVVVDQQAVRRDASDSAIAAMATEGPAP